MNILVATQTSGFLKPFALALGKILEYIYYALAEFGVYNIGFCIILMTFVVRMLMLPMQIKQQKFSKLTSVMNPEIQAIQKKYKNKKDQASQLAMQEEVQAVYDKYGTSPTGSCLQLIIQMPILFALYRVIMNVPAYVKPVKELYASVINGLTQAQMNQFFGINKAGSAITGSKLDKCIDAMSGARVTYKDAVTLTKGTSINDILEVADKGIADKINHINDFFGFNLSMSPSAMFKAGTITIIVALIIPVLAGLFQFLSVKLSTALNKMPEGQDNPMAGSMKVMNYMMPLMSVYMCYVLSTGIGIYWCAGSLVMMLQQFFINLYLKRIDVNDIIEKNKEKAAEKAEKRKIKQGIYREKVLEASKINTKTVSSNVKKDNEEKIRRAREASNKGSLASKANLVNDYNNRNSK